MYLFMYLCIHLFIYQARGELRLPPVLAAARQRVGHEAEALRRQRALEVTHAFIRRL